MRNLHSTLQAQVLVRLTNAHATDSIVTNCVRNTASARVCDELKEQSWSNKRVLHTGAAETELSRSRMPKETSHVPTRHQLLTKIETEGTSAQQTEDQCVEDVQLTPEAEVTCL